MTERDHLNWDPAQFPMEPNRELSPEVADD
jgi:hypothetical protein